MNKTELVNAVAEKADFSKKDADKAVAAVLDSITDGRSDDRSRFQSAGVQGR